MLADPVVASLNELREPEPAVYALDMIRVDDAIPEATTDYPINHETWANREPALHTHLMPRYLDEPAEKRFHPACMGYSWAMARPFDPAIDARFIEKISAILAPQALP